jgi:hypothetical protein
VLRKPTFTLSAPCAEAAASANASTTHFDFMPVLPLRKRVMVTAADTLP